MGLTELVGILGRDRGLCLYLCLYLSLGRLILGGGFIFLLLVYLW
jgi:hypothetical protein